MREYVIDNAIRMKMILDTYVLGENGYLIKALSIDSDETSFDVQKLHQIAFLKIFLTFDGSILINLAKSILQDEIDRLSFYESGQWDTLIKQLVEEYSQKKDLEYQDIGKLNRLRDFISRNKYNPETIRHHFPPRAGALSDFDIIKYEKKKSGGIVYKKTQKTQKFVDSFPDFGAIDQSLKGKTGDFYFRISNFMEYKSKKFDMENDFENISEHIKSAYECAKIENNSNIPLSAIDNAVSIRSLLGVEPNDKTNESVNPQRSKICEPIDVRAVLQKMIKESHNFRTHKNRQGLPFYLSKKK